MGAGSEKIRYGFVVLHYMAFEMTVECISKIMECFGNDDIKIVVVDNASSNKSGEKLAVFYRKNRKVDVLLNLNNDGFAGGNNKGYSYLKKNFHPEFIIVMNNDVLIEQSDFLMQIDKIYKETGFSVLGPDIYCPYTNKHQNPAHLEGFTQDEAKELYNLICKYCRYSGFYYYKKVIFDVIKQKILKIPQNIDALDRAMMMENVVLHGACYIFSPIFLEIRENCFCPKTFLYFEEDILHYECMRDGLKMIYSPNINVVHLEDVSTNAGIRNGFSRFKFKNNEMKKSINVFMQLMKGEL